jgi:predicted transcriptional regulator of viral defense system
MPSKRNGGVSRSERVLALAREHGLIRPSDLEPLGLQRTYLQRLCRAGLLERAGRGLYRLVGAEVTEHHALVAASRRVPDGVVCLLSALRYHGLGTQAPFEVWLAIDRKAWAPHLDHPPLRLVRMSGAALTEGVEEDAAEGVTIKVYSPAKTVADCFKYRNKIGLDVALEALREYRRGRRDLDELWRCARICRVANVMRPYLEALG